MAELPNRIRELRKSKGWTLQQLSDKIGCGITYLSDLERGDRELGMFWMKKLAKVFKVTPADLLSSKDNSRSLTAEEHELVNLYQHGDDAQRQQLLQMARIIVGPAVPNRKVA